jgi:hypothetical protein
VCRRLHFGNVTPLMSLKGLVQGGSSVQPCILGIVARPLSFTHCKAQGRYYREPKHAEIVMHMKVGFLHVFFKS